MVEENKLHEIFITDPETQRGFVDRPAKLVLKNGEILTGIIFTIDPVSQSIVLAYREKGSCSVIIKVVMKHSIESMEKLPESLSDEKIDFDNSFLKSSISIVSTENQKNKVKNWLERNMVPVSENKNILVLDNLEIHPPYGPEQCYSTNAIVMSRVQDLLRKMPIQSI